MANPDRPGAPSLWLLNLLTLIEPLDQYIHEVKRIAALGALEVSEKMRLLQEQSGRLSREMEGRFEALANELEQRKKDLQDVLAPPRPDLARTLQGLLAEVAALAEKLALKERLAGRWADQAAADILTGYEGALAAGDEALVEMFEAYAEDALKAKGEEAALKAFRARREAAREARRTPAQVRARQELQELEKLEMSLRLIGLVVSSTLKAGAAPLGEAPPPEGPDPERGANPSRPARPPAYL